MSYNVFANGVLLSTISVDESRSFAHLVRSLNEVGINGGPNEFKFDNTDPQFGGPIRLRRLSNNELIEILPIAVVSMA